ncbi:MAG TPA: SMP-30/gluconolactonase/LRE family protein, partial [Thermomicrobiales bacterium]|nr:SMP-30/gluconolactonase/LRE family protein [Thermomicrobiales bacterium]
MTARDAAGTPDNRHAIAHEPIGAEAPPTDLLHRGVAVGALGWAGALTAIAVLVAALLRLVQLDTYVLGQREASWAYDAWSLFHGRPLPAGQEVPTVAPLFLLVEALSFFMFGVTDAVARFGPAIFGIGIVLLVLALRPFVSRMMMVAMVSLVAISPTLVYASRTVDPAIAAAFSSLLVFVALLRAGHAGSTGASVTWSAVAGFGIAGALASGPAGVTALIALGLGLAIGAITDGVDDAGAVREAMARHGRSVTNQLFLGGGLVAGVLVLFTRAFSDVTALEGLLSTFADWGRMMGTQSSSTPQSFFFYAILLYEILAVVFAIVAVTTGPNEGVGPTLRPTAFGVWFLAALVLQSFASGRQSEHAVIVVLPLVLLGGLGLGHVFERIPWSRLWTTPAGLVPLALLGIVIGLMATIVIVARSNDVSSVDRSGWPALVQVLFVLVVVLIPLAYLIWSQLTDRFGLRDVGIAALLVVALLLGLFTFRTTTLLALSRADDGTEMLAEEVPTQGTHAFVNQVYRLSRDLSIDRMTNIDNTGSYGLSIAVSPEVEWPFVWYFRDFPNVRVTGPAGWTEGTDVVIAASPEGMENAGFVIQQKSWLNRAPTAYTKLDAGDIFGNMFSPSEWYSDLRFLLFRELDSKQAPAPLSVGYSFRVSNQINPNLGPFDLFTQNSPGPGSGLGQLSSPSGIALSPDGQVIYVMDAGNSRVERFGRDGTFIGVWDSRSDPNVAFAYQNGQGASSIVAGDDGLVYVADTWNHIVVVLDKDGKLVRQLGQRGALTDNADSPDPTLNPGLFFGPRGLVVTENEIYVTDTGNERVQVFGKDGTFLRAFGGFGTEPGKLQEPTGLAMGPDRNLYVADSGNGRISVFTPEGEFVREIAVPSWAEQLGTDRMNALAFGPDGTLYMTAPAR